MTNPRRRSLFLETEFLEGELDTLVKQLEERDGRHCSRTEAIRIAVRDMNHRLGVQPEQKGESDEQDPTDVPLH